jgi:hypothetical protein
VVEIIRFFLSDATEAEVGSSERPSDLQLLGTLWLNLDAKRTHWAGGINIEVPRKTAAMCHVQRTAARTVARISKMTVGTAVRSA